MKKIIIIVLLIFFACAKDDRMKDIELNALQIIHMFDMVRDGNTVVGLDQFNIVLYENSRLIREIPADPFNSNTSLFRITLQKDRLYGLSNRPLLYIYNLDSLLLRKDLLFNPWDIAPWQADSLLILGQYKDKAFHVFSHDGNYARSFGAIPEKIDPHIGPQHFFISDTYIYLGGILNYNIYIYQDGMLCDTLTALSPHQFKGPTIEKRGSIDAVYMKNGISGMGVYDGMLYVSTYHHVPKSRQLQDMETHYYLDAFDLETGERVFHHKSNNTFILHTDHNGVYLLINQTIKHWRGINDKTIAF